MPAYRFQTVDNAGQHNTGVIQADTARLGREALRERGLVVLDIELVDTGPEQAKTSLTPARGLKLSQLALLLGQLASILRAGLPLERALDACSRAVTGDREKEVLAALQSDVLAGFPLSEAMRRQPRVFDGFCVASVRAGERTARLDQVIGSLSHHLERREAINQKIRLALIYPALLVGVSLIIIIGLMQFVIPQVAAVFAHNKHGLPLITRALLNIAEFLKTSWLWASLVMIAAGFGLSHAWRTLPALRGTAEQWMLKLPILGPIIVDTDMAKVISTLGLLTGHSVPLVVALKAANEVASLDLIRTGMKQVGESVEQGSSLQRAMNEARSFPPIVVLLVGSGEESGRLPAMLDEAAQRLTTGVTTRIDALLRLFEPLVVLVMGGVVLLIVLAVLLPIFEMNQLVK